MPRCYVTLISTDGYLPGVLTLAYSLRAVGSRAPLVVAVGPAVGTEAVQKIEASGLPIHRVSVSQRAAEIAAGANASVGMTHWTNTFEKIAIFSMTAWETIVFVDCDMFVQANIDDLFERPHLSAVAAGRSYPGNENWTQLNSGLMVIEPRADLSDQILSKTGEVAAEKPAFGDQDLLHAHYPEWPDLDGLHLPEGYNIFHQHLSHYKQIGYGNASNPIHAVHFVGPVKPWQKSRGRQLRTLARHFARREFAEIRCLNSYSRLLHDSDRWLASTRASSPAASTAVAAE